MSSSKGVRVSLLNGVQDAHDVSAASALHTGPTVVAFPAGPPPQLEAKKLQFRLFAKRKAGGAGKLHRVVGAGVATSDDDEEDEAREFASRLPLVKDGVSFQFQASNFGSEHSFTRDHAKYAIGVFQGAQRKLDLVAVPHIYQMRTKELKRRAEHKAEETDWQVRQGQHKQLIETFGSKKKLRALRTKEINRIDVTKQTGTTAVSDRLLQGGHDDEDLEAADLAMLDKVNAARLPTYDTEADTSEAIYDLHSIISKSLWESMDHKPMLKCLRSASSVDMEGVSGFVLWVKRQQANSHDKKRLARMATAMGWLQTLALLDARNLGRSVAADALLTTAGEMVQDELLSKFAKKSRGKWSAPPALQNKLLSYICVLALFMCDFQIAYEGVELLMTDLKRSKAVMTEILRAVGAKVAGAGVNKIVTLPAPLKLPGLKSGARGGKKRT